ncbi:MAG: c-type cytochrome [Betaproteobacteria bacterium]
MKPVSGPSRLNQLGLSMDRSALGQVGGTGSAPDTGRHEPTSIVGRDFQPPGRTFSLAGADLYRLNCQACHGPDGRGSPPEITSLLDPVRGASAELLTRRLEARGRAVDRAFVKSIVAGAERDLLQRLAQGGKEMPPFGWLRDDERAAIIGYLMRLARVPEARPEGPLVAEPSVRVGELLVKGTCHICHDAGGPRRDRMAVMMSGAIPALSTVVADYSLGQIVEKVRTGQSGMMMMMRQSRMPAFPYITPEEAAAAVAYLTVVPPQP